MLQRSITQQNLLPAALHQEYTQHYRRLQWLLTTFRWKTVANRSQTFNELTSASRAKRLL
jgi:hypothetical protein